MEPNVLIHCQETKEVHTLNGEANEELATV